MLSIKSSTKCRKNSSKPVFYDPKNRRWRWFKVIVQVLGLLITLIFCGLMASILTTPFLPNLALAPVRLLSQQSHASAPTVIPTPTVIILQGPVAQILQQGKVETYHQEKLGLLKPAKVIKRFHVSPKNPALPGTALPSPLGSATLAPTAGGTSPTPTPAPTFSPVLPAAPGSSEVIGFYSQLGRQ